MITDKIILFSYDKPTQYINMLNASPGIWNWTISPGVVVVTDDNGNTGYYVDQNIFFWQVFSVLVDGSAYSQVDTYDDLLVVDSSWYYDGSTTRIYLHFAEFEPPLNKTILLGIGVGYANRSTSDNLSYYNNFHYAERITSIQPIKKSVDPLFFGILKYQGGKITLNNMDGEFDDWRARNLFGQASRTLMGNNGDAYSSFIQYHTGFIENDNRTFESLQITTNDIRKSLTQPVARNLLTKTEFIDLDDGDIDKEKPVVYGSRKNTKPICVNPNIESGNFKYLFMDTECNQASSITVYSITDGVYSTIVPASINYTTGIFELTFAQGDGKEITCDIVTSISNGVDIIKDLMYRYDGKNYIASFWDLVETAAAQIDARDTSLYIDSKDKKLYSVIESVCFDVDARFFAHDTGKYTIRLYDEDRAVSRTIENDEWLSEPTFSNNGTEYMTSAIIKFNYDQNRDTFEQLEYKDYEAIAYGRYKKYKVETFETQLTDEISAIEKADTIMKYSSNIQDIISRTIIMTDNTDEIGDFILCDPISRYGAVSTKAIYEILGLEKDLPKEEKKLTLRYVKADPTADYEYDALVDESGNYITDISGNTITTITEAV